MSLKNDLPPDQTKDDPAAAGVTPTERYLNRLASRSFLSMWSYPGLYRDQGVGERGGEGAEICDLLVLFDKDILIFSDKDCEFPDIQDVELAWQRWFRRAILKSADQIWGAERWIRKHPERLFLDRACKKRLPIRLPDLSDARFHRIVVAHDRSGRRKQCIGGTGSLLIDPSVVGDMHLRRQSEGGHPFAIGFIDPSRGYVHVFDDASLGKILRTVDTISDFVHYLSRKEAFIRSGRLHGAYGEEDLLAFYLKRVNKNGEHDFVIPKTTRPVLIEEGQWADFLARPERRRQVEADHISYIWDKIIEEFAENAIKGTLAFSSGSALSDHERILRVLAREPRTRRRMLARALAEKVTKSIPPGEYSFRVVEPSKRGDPHYVFVVSSLPREVQPSSPEAAVFRMQRVEILKSYCMVAMHHFDQAERVIGIATENGTEKGRSHDLIQIERTKWDSVLDAEAVAIQKRTGWLRRVRVTRGVEDEYPRSVQQTSQNRPGRNAPCPCGSGRKFKHCHGRNRVN